MLKENFFVNQVVDFYQLKEELLSNEGYDFIIIDRTLKDISAKDVFSNLIDLGINFIPPSILLTQNRYNPDDDGSGYSFVLRKPFQKNEILEAVNFVLLERESKKLNKILIVDDSKTSRNIMKRILKAYGYECFEAENATIGLKKAEEILPDLIIVDYIMPDLNGIEFADKISQDKKLKNIPIILITGSLRFNEVVEKGFNSGISAYFKKPFNEEEVIGFIKKYFGANISSKILLVEDSYTRRKVITSSLTINNNQVISTDTIEKALFFLEDNIFDLILIDLVLNNETAFDAVKVFRRINENIPIIVYSSIADRQNIYKILELGASDFLWAPIEMRELILKVKIWLGYSKFLNLKDKMQTFKKLSNATNFMEHIDANLNIDKLNENISTFICIDCNKRDIENEIKKNLREDDKLGFYNNKFFIYLSSTNVIDALKVCKRIKNSINIPLKFGISTSDSIETVEQLFLQAEKNIVNI